MVDKQADDNWLHAEVFPCPFCQQALFRVDRSPFYDGYRLYCDKCANSVEVSYYDPVTMALGDQIRREGKLAPGREQTIAVLRLIERRLNACSCGGRYHYDAPRRCPFCLAPALLDESWVDLFPGDFGVSGDDEPSSEQIAQYDAYQSKHVRERDIW